MPQFIYSLHDPIEPEIVRYVGRTNDLELRLRMHLSSAESGFTIKDVWLTYLRYYNREAEIGVLETCCTAGNSDASETLAKERERHWINLHSSSEFLLNSNSWSGHASRKSIPKAIKQAWCETHVLLWTIDREWKDERHLLQHLHEQYGPVSRSIVTSRGTLVESLGELSLATSQFEGRRHRCWSILKHFLKAYPGLAVGDIEQLASHPTA